MAMGYGLGVLRIERGNENGFNAEEEAKKKKGLSMQNRGRVHHLSLFLSLCPNLILYFIVSLFLCFFPRSSLPLSLSLSLFHRLYFYFRVYFNFNWLFFLLFIMRAF